jgi:hypothetical protein
VLFQEKLLTLEFLVQVPMASLAAGGKSAQITLLVQQLKAGEITKEELFVKLQRLQSSVSSIAPEARAAAAPGPSVSGPARVKSMCGGRRVYGGRRAAPLFNEGP